MRTNAVVIVILLSVIASPLGFCDSVKEEPLPTTRAEIKLTSIPLTFYSWLSSG